jgi:hypothetical protein
MALGGKGDSRERMNHFQGATSSCSNSAFITSRLGCHSTAQKMGVAEVGQGYLYTGRLIANTYAKGSRLEGDSQILNKWRL